MLSRAALLKRIGAVGAVASLPPSLLELLDATDGHAGPKTATEEKRDVAPRVREWWFEPESYPGFDRWTFDGKDWLPSRPMRLLRVSLNDPARRVNIELHFVPEGNGLYVQFPPGREREFEKLEITVSLHPLTDHKPIPIELRPSGPKTLTGHQPGLGYVGVLLG